MRKAFAGAKQRMKVGKSKEYSDLDGAQDNGWIFKDSDVSAGVNYRVKYLGSVEVDFDASSSSNNQEHAQKAMRALRSYTKGQPQAVPKLVLTVSVGSIELKSLDGSKVIMRHSTTRIAYSTVDAENPKLFGYVGMVKDTNLTLCHIFKCKNAKQGYEMTFVCAQAFDLNFRSYQKDKEKALADGGAATATGADIEPTKAWQKKVEPGAAAAKKEETGDTAETPAATGSGGAEAGATAGGGADDAAPEGTGYMEAETVDEQLPTTKSRRTSLVPAEAAAGVEVERAPVFLAIMSGQNPVDLAQSYFAGLGVNMIEDDAPAAPSTIAAAVPNVLEVGVEAGAYNKARRESLGAADGGRSDGGYMTVGADMAFDDDEEDDWE